MTVPYDYDQTNIDHLRAVIAEQEQTIKYLHEHCKAEEVENVKLQDENVKLRELVREFSVRVLNSGHQWGLDGTEVIAEYAAKLQLKEEA